MEEKDQKVETRPPAVIDWLVRALIPPMAREAVVGDLWERYRSPLQYLSEAFRILPYVVSSQIRRNTGMPMLAISAFLFFVFCFGGLADADPPPDIPRWLRAAIPTIAALAGLILRDAYRQGEQRPTERAALDIVTAVIFVMLSQAILAGLILGLGWSPDWMLSPRRAVRTAAGLPMLFCLRLAGDYRLPGITGELSAADVVREFHRFERAVRWRNRAILIGGILGAVVSIMLLWRAARLSPSLAPAIGWAISTPIGLLITWLIFRKTLVQPMPVGLTFAPALAFYRRELERQSKLLRNVWWWYLLSIVPAVAGGMIGGRVAGSQQILGPIRLAHVLGYLVICFFVGWLYLQYAQRIQRRIESLGAVSEQR